MDAVNNSDKKTVIKVTDWLRGVWEMRRRAGPVQQWVDSIPSPVKSNISVSLDQEKCTFHSTCTSAVTRTQPKDIPCSKENLKYPNMTLSAPVDVPGSPLFGASRLPSSLPHPSKLPRDPSLQSDSSHCSSVESLLELRRTDPEAVLLGLGFGGCSPSTQDGGPLSRIPKRFLQPSRLKGIAINEFVKHQQECSESLDSVSLGYRGLTGSPYVAPSEIVQKIMERLREHESHELDTSNMYSCCDQQHSPMRQNGKLSVLSPDNRLFLEQPRSRSPDMRNKRMILGHRSYAFDCDGDLIEIHASTVTGSANNCKDDDVGGKMVKAYAESTPTPTPTLTPTPTPPLESERIDSSRMQVCALSRYKFTENSSHQSATSYEPTNDSPTDREKPNRTAVTSHASYVRASSVNESRASGRGRGHAAHSPEGRRASEGHCGDSFTRDESRQETGRRHSDSLIEGADDRYSEPLIQKRKSLKRQPRVVDRSDLAADEQLAQLEFRDSTAADSVQLSRAAAEDPHHRVAQKTQPQEDQAINSIRFDDDIKVVNNTDFPETNSSEPYNDECYIHSHDSSAVTASYKDEARCTECCCHADGTKCWKKVERIIQENKKLEDLVVKSRKEMAEIRGMLSNVLSVRLEPGF